MVQILGLLLALSPIFMFMGLFTWLRRSAQRHAPRQEGSALEFFVSPGMQFLLRLVLIALSAFCVLVLVTSRSGEGVYAVLIPLTVLFALLLTKPRSVILDQNGIRQPRSIWGVREIGWNEVGSVERGRNTGSIYVRSRNGGRPVSFSPLLVGQSRFERELRARTRDCFEYDE